MAETIRLVDYFYTEVPDKPGEEARILGQLREAGVYLLVFLSAVSMSRAGWARKPCASASHRAS